MRIDVLPDDVLLGIFDFYINAFSPYTRDKSEIEAWQSLVHVCRRWRSIVFGSPRRLNLRLCCTPETPAKDRLDVWPALPLFIIFKGSPVSGTDNIIAALGQRNRVRQVILGGRQLGEVLATMQVPFPELVEMHLWSKYKSSSASPVIPDSFLGGSAPRLQKLRLSSLSFPGLPTLLLSAIHLVDLYLDGIPHSGYISPEAMVTTLSAMPNLKMLHLEFQSRQSRPDWESQSLPPPEHAILPALYKFHFRGVAEYLEELVTGIDTPQLTHMEIFFFDQSDFDCSRLTQFINRTPDFSSFDEARVVFCDSGVSVILRHRTSSYGFDDLLIDIICSDADRQLPFVERVLNPSLHFISTVEVLYIEDEHHQNWKSEVIENTLRLELLLPFTALKNFFLCDEFAPGIADDLQELVGARLTEVLPSLQNIFIDWLEPPRSFQENIRGFIAARQLSDHPISTSYWNRYTNGR